MELGALAPGAAALAAAVALDLVAGDPQYRWHPIRLMGASIRGIEGLLRRVVLDGYVGGVVLGVAATTAWVVTSGAALVGLARVSPAAAFVLHVLIVYSLLALRNLLDHGWAVERAARGGDIAATRRATAMFVARDTAALDTAACRRASIESLSENLTDGYVSPILWYVVLGVPGLVAFKVFSTLDSMVGNRSPRYLRFGWFSARFDDLLNWIPARLTWLLIALASLLLPRCSAPRALAVGWRQHAIVPGPNSGWSEAATAGALGVRLVGPIVHGGVRVTDAWLGDAHAPAAGSDRRDVPLAIALTLATGLAAAAIGVAIVAGYTATLW